MLKNEIECEKDDKKERILNEIKIYKNTKEIEHEI